MDEYPFIDDCQKVAHKEMREKVCQDDKPGPCKDLQDVDLAGAILKHIYGKEALASERVETEEDQVLAFDQRRIFEKFFPDTWHTDAENASMAKRAYVFIPKTCKEGSDASCTSPSMVACRAGKPTTAPGIPETCLPSLADTTSGRRQTAS